MIWNRNDGNESNDIIQNKFTAYLLSAVKRRRAQYIDNTLKHQYLPEINWEVTSSDRFDFDAEYFMDMPICVKIQNEKLYQILFELSERERYVFFNRVLGEKSFVELAIELGLTYKGVAAVYYRTIQKIRKMMKGGNSR